MTCAAANSYGCVHLVLARILVEIYFSFSQKGPICRNGLQCVRWKRSKLGVLYCILGNHTGRFRNHFLWPSKMLHEMSISFSPNGGVPTSSGSRRAARSMAGLAPRPVHVAGYCSANVLKGWERHESAFHTIARKVGPISRKGAHDRGSLHTGTCVDIVKGATSFPNHYSFFASPALRLRLRPGSGPAPAHLRLRPGSGPAPAHLRLRPGSGPAPARLRPISGSGPAPAQLRPGSGSFSGSGPALARLRPGSPAPARLRLLLRLRLRLRHGSGSAPARLWPGGLV